MTAAYDALPTAGTADTRQIAARIGASVHMTNRALDRLVTAGKVRKTVKRPFANSWERV